MRERRGLLELRSLRAKFLVVVVPLLLLSTGLVFGVSEAIARRDAQERLQKKLEELVAIQSGVLSESMWNVADEQIALILSALAIDPDVLGAVVYDESGNVISAVGVTEDLQRQPLFSKRDIVYRQGEREDRIGQLAVALTDARLRADARSRIVLSTGLAASLLAAVVFIALIGNRRTIGVPLERLLGSINHFHTSGERRLVDWRSRDEIGQVVSAFNEMQLRQSSYENELREARDHLERRVDERTRELTNKSNALEQLSNKLAKYLPPQVYDSIFTGKQEVKVASTRKKLTVFFSDIAGFTETADRLESEELTRLVNHYLNEMSQIALRYGATIDKYMGDGIMIFFGDPESAGVKEDALACVKMAIAMRERMYELRDHWRDTGIERPLRVRMGIHTGYCTVGNFGSEDRLDYTIIGGAANTASRLETAAEPGEILVSYETFALIKDAILCEETGQIEVKGIAYPVATFRVLNTYDALRARRRHLQEEHPNLKIDLDFDTMSKDDRRRATRLLREALDLLAEAEVSPGERSPMAPKQRTPQT